MKSTVSLTRVAVMCVFRRFFKSSRLRILIRFCLWISKNKIYTMTVRKRRSNGSKRFYSMIRVSSIFTFIFLFKKWVCLLEIYFLDLLKGEDHRPYHDDIDFICTTFKDKCNF